MGFCFVYMRTILDIYDQYNIINNLQIHQLRVTAVALSICRNFSDSIKIDKESIIKACLLHDMGNIIKYKMDVFPEVFEPQGVEYWQKVKDEYINKYGSDEHTATLSIIRELGLSEYIVNLVEFIECGYAESHKNQDNFDKKIVCYADNRVSPHGIVSLSVRREELLKRYSYSLVSRDKHLYEIEKQIFLHCKIKPEDITEESCQEIIEDLKKYKI